MICKNCGKEIPDTAKFCPECGHPVTHEPPKQPAVSTTIMVNGVSIDLVDLAYRKRFIDSTSRKIDAIKEIRARVGAGLSISAAKKVMDDVMSNPQLMKEIKKELAEKDKEFEAEEQAVGGTLHCPICHSRRIEVSTQGYSVTKGLVATFFLGPIGSLFGAHNATKEHYKCLDCGHKWEKK